MYRQSSVFPGDIRRTNYGETQSREHRKSKTNSENAFGAIRASIYRRHLQESHGSRKRDSIKDWTK